MDSTSHRPYESQNLEERRTPVLEESDSDEEFFDALVNDDDVVTCGETKDVEKEQHRTSDKSMTRIVDDLIQSEFLSPAEDRTADNTQDDATRTCEDSSDSSSEDVSEDKQFDRLKDHDKSNGTIEDTRPGGDATNHEGVRAEQEEGEEMGAEPDQLDGGVTLDEEAIRELEDQMTEEEKQAKREEAQTHKTRGNELFKAGEFADAVFAYSQALQLCPLCFKKDRSVMYANRAASKVRQEDLEGAIADCTTALELNPLYLKVILRRAQAYELTDKLEDSLKDYQKALELDPRCFEARAACMRLPDQIKERNEKLKAEMMSKLKELGNLCLRPFGLSTDNFQLNQDPGTGSYSVNFTQNPGGTNGN